MPKRLPKVIADAERHRRTLEKPACRSVWFGGGTSAEPATQVPKTASKVMEIAPKSMKNPVGAPDAFWERSGGGPGGPTPQTVLNWRSRLGTLFR